MAEHRLCLAPSQTLAPQAAASPSPSAKPVALMVDSVQLLQGRPEITISHQGQHYRLRVTSLGKLILIK